MLRGRGPRPLITMKRGKDNGIPNGEITLPNWAAYSNSALSSCTNNGDLYKRGGEGWATPFSCDIQGLLCFTFFYLRLRAILAMHSDPTYPLFPVFAFFGFILPLIPLQWHLAAWNSGTCYFMIWTSLASLNQFINSIVWADNVTNWAPWWCEICTIFSLFPPKISLTLAVAIRIQIGASVAVPASCMCIQRRLYQIASVRAVSVTRPEVCRDNHCRNAVF